MSRQTWGLAHFAALLVVLALALASHADGADPQPQRVPTPTGLPIAVPTATPAFQISWPPHWLPLVAR